MATMTAPALLAALGTLDRFDRRSGPLDPKDPERVYRAVNRRRDILTAGALPSVRRHFELERLAVGRTLRANGEPVSVFDLMQAVTEQQDDLERRLERIQTAAAGAWGRRLIADIVPSRRVQRSVRVEKRELEPWLQAALQQLQAAGAQKVVGISDTTRAQLQAILIASQEAGEGLFALQKRIDRLYLEDIIPHRSEVIARTEIAAAQGAGSQSAMRDVSDSLGVVIRKSWLATLSDQRTRRTHLDAHRTYQQSPIDLDDFYIVGNSTLRFPADPEGRPEDIIQCRCTETYQRAGRIAA